MGKAKTRWDGLGESLLTDLMYAWINTFGVPPLGGMGALLNASIPPKGGTTS